MAEPETQKFEHDLGTDRGRMRTKFGDAQTRDGDFRSRKSAKSGQF